MNIKDNIIQNKHEKYDNYKKHQIIIDDLIKDDIVTVNINGIEVFTFTVIHAIKSDLNLVVQDKGNKSIVLTDKQKDQAIFEYKEKYKI